MELTEHWLSFPPQWGAVEVLAVYWPNPSLPDQEPAAEARSMLP